MHSYVRKINFSRENKKERRKEVPGILFLVPHIYLALQYTTQWQLLFSSAGLFICCNSGCFEGLCSSSSEIERSSSKKTSRVSYLCFSYTTGPTRLSRAGTRSPPPPGSKQRLLFLVVTERHRPLSYRSPATKGRWKLG